jgi:hypothetical protein
MKSPSPYSRRCLAWLTMVVTHLRLHPEGLIPSQPWPNPARILWFHAAPAHPQAIHLCLVHLISSASHSYYLMPRPRGRPRRGSPWKPRRPSVSPPDSPSICSSPPSSPSISLLPLMLRRTCSLIVWQ